MRRDPEHLGRGKSGHDEIASAFLDVGNASLELDAFGEGAAVVPQDRRAEMDDYASEFARSLRPTPGLAIDCALAVARIEAFIQTSLRKLNRRGCVLGVSGGVDSAVCAHLAARALGRDRVLALLMPERESTADGLRRARHLCESPGVRQVEEDITASLEAVGCYRRRDEAIRMEFPGYGTGWRQKIAIVAGKSWTPHFNLIVESPSGGLFKRKLSVHAYLQIVAATNFKHAYPVKADTRYM